MEKEVTSSLHVYVNNRRDLPFLKYEEPYIVERPSMKIMKIPSRYLRRAVVDSAKRGSAKTWLASAYHVKAWFEFLIAQDVPWRLASVDTLLDFRDGYLEAHSPLLAKRYATSTVRSALLTVLDFYKHARAAEGYSGELGDEVAVDELAVLTTGPQTGNRKGIARRNKSALNHLVPAPERDASHIRPLTVAEWRKVQAALGPLPSEAGIDAHTGASASLLKQIRDRLLCELPFQIGLRVEETSWLLESQFLAARGGGDLVPAGYSTISLAKESTKGNKGGSVRVPNWLVDEVCLFIEFKRRSYKYGDDRPLLQGHRAKVNKSRMSVRRLQQVFEKAQLEAGVTEFRTRHDLDNGSFIHVLHAKHRFHDLRHSYATWTYVAKRLSGDPDPWKWIQQNLRHSDVRTTIETYITYVNLTTGETDAVDLRTLLWRGSEAEDLVR